MSLEISKNSYQELSEALKVMPEFSRFLIEPILCEYLSVKCAEEIKRNLKEDIYKYLTFERTLAGNILKTDDHKMPRDFKRLQEAFMEAEFGLEGLEDIQQITLIRNQNAHQSTSSVPYTWNQLKEKINNASKFLDNFDKYIRNNKIT